MRLSRGLVCLKDDTGAGTTSQRHWKLRRRRRGSVAHVLLQTSNMMDPIDALGYHQGTVLVTTSFVDGPHYSIKECSRGMSDGDKDEMYEVNRSSTCKIVHQLAIGTFLEGGTVSP